MRKIKGFVTYVYKGAQYFEQPKHTHISKIEYDEADNMSIVYLRRNKIFIELLSIVVLCAMIYFVYNNGEYAQIIHMPKYIYYFDNKLYLNVVADESNSNPVSYEVAGRSGVLNPGESLDYIDYTYNNQISEKIVYTVTVFGFDKTFSNEFPIGTLQVDDGGLEYEGY